MQSVQTINWILPKQYLRLAINRTIGVKFASPIPSIIVLHFLRFELNRCVMLCTHLFARDAGVPVGGGAKYEVVEDGGVGGDADASADHDCNLELVPVLVTAAKRTLRRI
jgi:hypothetical protein